MNENATNTENIIEVENPQIVTLNDIHNDLGVLTSFITLFFVAFIFLFIYRAMNHFFNV